jgi:antitoxin ParD1/3/4
MATMNVSLPDPMRDWVDAQVKSGAWANASDYVRDLIRHDQERHHALKAAIAEGLASGAAPRERLRRGSGMGKHMLLKPIVLALVAFSSQALAGDRREIWSISEGAPHKAGIFCEECGDMAFSHATVTCETAQQGVLGKTRLYMLDYVCIPSKNCRPSLVVNGIRFSVPALQDEDDEGIFFVISQSAKLWQVLKRAESLRLLEPNGKSYDYTKPGLTEAFSTVLETCPQPQH